MKLLNFTFRLLIVLYITNMALGRYLTKHKRVAEGRWLNEDKIAAFESSIRNKEEVELQGNKIVNMGCWRDAWDRAVTPLEGRHIFLMEPNYKTRSYALYKCARAAMDNKLKMFGVENGGQCMGSANAESLYKRHGPAKGCQADGKGGPWSLQVYRFEVARPKILNGNYNDWSQWTACTKICGKGVQRRMRKCSNPAPANGGQDCSRLGPSVESGACNTHPCSVADPKVDSLTSDDLNLEEELGTDDRHMTNTQPKFSSTKMGQPIQSAVLTAEAESSVEQPLSSSRLAQYKTKPKVKPLKPVQAVSNKPGLATSVLLSGISTLPDTTSECLCPSKVCKAKGEIGFVVDSSAVVPLSEFIRALQLVKTLSRGFEGKETHFGLVAYGKQTKKAFDLESPPDFQQLDQLIDSASYMGGETKIGNALSKAQLELFAKNSRKRVPKALVLVSSGESTDDVTFPSSDIRDSGVKITSVGLGKFARVNDLINAASEPKSEHVFTAFFERNTLPRTIDGIIQAVCKDLVGELKDQKEECTCESNAKNNFPRSQLKVKQTGDDQQTGQQQQTKYHDESIVLSVPEKTAAHKIKSDDHPAHLSNKMTPSLPAPILPMVMDKSSQNGTISSFPSESQETPGITSVHTIPPTKNKELSKQECKVNLAVVLDGSATVDGYEKGNFRRLLQFVKKLTRSFPVSQDGNHLSLLVFSSEPKTIFDFHTFSDQASIDEAIDKISYPNKGVLTGKALEFAAKELFSKSPSGKNVLLLITDGPSFDDVREPATELKRRGVEIFCLGIGQGYAKNQLSFIASDPVSKHLLTAPFKNTENVIGPVKDRICRTSKNTDDTIAFSPPNKKTFIAKLHAAGRPLYDSHMTNDPRREGNLYHLLNDVIR